MQRSSEVMLFHEKKRFFRKILLFWMGFPYAFWYRVPLESLVLLKSVEYHWFQRYLLMPLMRDLDFKKLPDFRGVLNNAKKPTKSSGREYMRPYQVVWPFSVGWLIWGEVYRFFLFGQILIVFSLLYFFKKVPKTFASILRFGMCFLLAFLKSQKAETLRFFYGNLRRHIRKTRIRKLQKQ